MMGQLAALDGYDPSGGFGLSPDEMTARTSRDPSDMPTSRERILDYQQSPIGWMQNVYRKAPDDAWAKHDDAQLQQDIVPDVGMNLFAASPQQAPAVANAQTEGVKDVANWMIPQSPSDAALMFALGPVGGKLARATVGAAGVMGSLMDPAEAGVRDPRLWSAISKQKLRKPLDEMMHGYTDVRTPVPKFVNPEDLVGGYGIFTPWDLSAANKTLTHVDDLKLSMPVRLHGGVGFPEANPGMAAASEQAISRKLDNQAALLTEKTGKPVYIMPMTMSPTGVDASHHVADPLSQLVKKAKITTEDANAFDDVMRASVPDWVGIQDKGFRRYINNLEGGMTTKAMMANRMALAEWQAKGFPDVAAVRHAVSEPGLIDMPRNTTGMAISRYIPGQGLLETTHPSYPKGVAGQHMGQLASLVPFETAAPSIAEGLAQYNARNMAAGKKQMVYPAYHMGRPAEGVPTAQYFDNEWADNIRKLWGDLK